MTVPDSSRIRPLILSALLFLPGCSDGVQDRALAPEDQLDAGTQPVDMTPPAYDPEDPRTWPDPAGISGGASSAMAIDTSQYAVHMVDSYGDHFYLNRIPAISNVPSRFRGYHGVFVHLSCEFPASVIYDATTKTLAASLDYLSNENMVYNATLASENYFTGSYTWTRTSSASLFKLRVITLSVLKGSL